MRMCSLNPKGRPKGSRHKATIAVLELLDGEQLKPHGSRYAKHVLETLSEKPQGQVLNRSELVKDDMGIDYWEMSLGPGKRLVNFTDPSGHDIEVCETPFKD